MLNPMLRTFTLLVVMVMAIMTITDCSKSAKGRNTDNLLEGYIKTNGVALKNAHLPLAKIVDSLKLDKKDFWLQVDKSELLLSFMYKDSILKQYPVVLGGNVVDDKRREGDQCTPEGTFTVRALYPHKSWSYFIWFDYPTKESWDKHKKAKADGLIPQDARIGGEVGIHGVPVGKDFIIDEKIHWTLGCVSLKTDAISEIYRCSYQGMKVIITP